jgi:hypothetical protein
MWNLRHLIWRFVTLKSMSIQNVLLFQGKNRERKPKPIVSHHVYFNRMSSGGAQAIAFARQRSKIVTHCCAWAPALYTSVLPLPEQVPQLVVRFGDMDTLWRGECKEFVTPLIGAWRGSRLLISNGGHHLRKEWVEEDVLWALLSTL